MQVHLYQRYKISCVVNKEGNEEKIVEIKNLCTNVILGWSLYYMVFM